MLEGTPRNGPGVNWPSTGLRRRTRPYSIAKISAEEKANHPSPRGLLDIPGWQTLTKGEAAQAVEVSAYPDRYANYEPVADRILNTLTAPGQTTPIPASGRIVFPLPEGTWVATSPFGMRVHPITGDTKLHTGADYAAPDGTPILAAADGVVTHAYMFGG